MMAKTAQPVSSGATNLVFADDHDLQLNCPLARLDEAKRLQAIVLV